VANVTVAGTDAAVFYDGQDHEYEDYGGDLARMDDGSLRDSRKGRKNIWKLVSTLLSAANAATLETAITTAPPLTCSGDVLGATFSCVGVLVKKQRVVTNGTVMYRVHFELREV
jgi:hypothetical protein